MAGLRVASVDWDLRDAAATATRLAASPPGAVIHLASVSRAIEPWHALGANLDMLRSLVTGLSLTAPEAPLLVAGSAAQYGMGAHRPLTEHDPTVPVSAYGAVKCVLERALLAAPLTRPLRVIWARGFNHIGPGQSPDAPVAHWAGQVAEAEAAGGGTVRTGARDVVRDFIDVRDVADAYLALLASDAAGVVNVASGVATRLEVVASLLVGMARTPIEFVHDPALDRAVDPPVVVGDPGQLHALTAWRPRIALADSVRDALDEWRAAGSSGRRPPIAGATR